MAAYIGELVACLFVYRGDTHIDPPTMALVVTCSIFPLVHLSGAFHSPEWLSLLMVLGVVIVGYLILTKLKKQSLFLS